MMSNSPLAKENRKTRESSDYFTSDRPKFKQRNTVGHNLKIPFTPVITTETKKAYFSEENKNPNY